MQTFQSLLQIFKSESVFNILHFKMHHVRSYLMSYWSGAHLFNALILAVFGCPSQMFNLHGRVTSTSICLLTVNFRVSCQLVLLPAALRDVWPTAVDQTKCTHVCYMQSACVLSGLAAVCPQGTNGEKNGKDVNLQDANVKICRFPLWLLVCALVCAEWWISGRGLEDWWKCSMKSLPRGSNTTNNWWPQCLCVPVHAA